KQREKFLAKKKAAKKKKKAAKQAKKDAKKIQDALKKSIEEKTKVLWRKLECLSESEKEGVCGEMDGLMKEMRRMCIKEVLQQYCKEMELKRHCFLMIKAKKVRKLIKECNKDNSSSAKPMDKEALKQEKENMARAQACDDFKQMKKCLKRAAQLLKGDINTVLKEDAQELKKKTRPRKTNPFPSGPQNKYLKKMADCVGTKWNDIDLAKNLLSSAEKKTIHDLQDCIQEKFKAECRKAIIQGMCEDAWGKPAPKEDKPKSKKKEPEDAVTDPKNGLEKCVEQKWKKLRPYIKSRTKADNIDFHETSAAAKKIIKKFCKREKQNANNLELFTLTKKYTKIAHQKKYNDKLLKENEKRRLKVLKKQKEDEKRRKECKEMMELEAEVREKNKQNRKKECGTGKKQPNTAKEDEGRKKECAEMMKLEAEIKEKEEKRKKECAEMMKLEAEIKEKEEKRKKECAEMMKLEAEIRQKNSAKNKGSQQNTKEKGNRKKECAEMMKLEAEVAKSNLAKKKKEEKRLIECEKMMCFEADERRKNIAKKRKKECAEMMKLEDKIAKFILAKKKEEEKRKK
ncbi:hypothetical protein KR018_007110, partial [Drosophila ironensis]